MNSFSAAFAAHPVWMTLAVACLVWYSTITIWVAVKGAVDVRDMLRQLRKRDAR